MTQQIIIEDGIARIVEQSIIGEAPLAALSDLIVTRKPTIFPVVPDHTRLAAFDPNSGKGMLFIEKSPSVELITVHWDQGNYGAVDIDYSRRDGDDNTEFRLPLPWLYFAYTFQTIPGDGRDHTVYGVDTLVRFSIIEADLFWRKEQMRSADDMLTVAKLPNVESTAHICWGGTRADTTSLSARIDEQTKTFFRTIFNNHLRMPMPADYTSYTAWEKDADKLLAWMSWDNEWDPTNTTQVKALDHINACFATAPTAGQAIGLRDGGANWDLPEPPNIFTIGRARQWARNLDPRARRAMLAAIEVELAAAPHVDGEIMP